MRKLKRVRKGFSVLLALVTALCLIPEILLPVSATDYAASAPERKENVLPAGDNVIFANGTPITVEAAPNGARVWYMDGSTKTYVTSNGEDGEDLSGWYIVVGSDDRDGMSGVNGSLTMTGGTVRGICAGQFYAASFSGTSTITVTGGQVTEGIYCNSYYRNNSDTDYIGTVTIFDSVGINLITAGGKADNLLQKTASGWTMSGTPVVPDGTVVTVAVGETLTVTGSSVLNSTIINYGTINVDATLVNQGHIVNYGTINMACLITGNAIEGSGTIHYASDAYIDGISSVSSISAKIDGSDHTVSSDSYVLANGQLYLWLPDGNAMVTVNGTKYYGSITDGTQTELTTSCKTHIWEGDSPMHCAYCEISECGALGHIINTSTGRCDRCGIELDRFTVSINSTVTNYHDLTDALQAVKDCTAADNAVITVQMNVSFESCSFEISSGVFALNLNGYTLSCPNSDACFLKVSGSDAHVSILDTRGNGSISGSMNGVLVAGGSLTVSGGSIIGIQYGINISDGNVSITGGSVSSSMTGICCSGGSLTVSGGDVCGVFIALQTRGGNVTISGGDFRTTRGTSATLSATGGTLVINGGTIHASELHISIYNSSVTLSCGANGTGATFRDGLKAEAGIRLAEGSACWQNGKQLSLTGSATKITGDDVVVMRACQHTNGWSDATCTIPRTCDLCGATDGDALGHAWKYTANGTTITAVCTASGCTNTDGGQLTIAVPEDRTYTAGAIEATITNTLKTGADVTVDYSGDGLMDGKPVNVGTYTATIRLGDAEATVRFTITAASLGGAAVVLEEATYTYDGTEKTPGVTVTLDEKTLTKDTDYTVTYSDNVNAGTATVTVTGMGNFTGTKEITFVINKAEVSISSDSSPSNVYRSNMYITAVVRGVDGDLLPGTAVATVHDGEGNELNRVTCEKETAAGTYFYNWLNQLSDDTYLSAGTYVVKLTYQGNDNYNAKIVELFTYTILKADPSYNIPAVNALTYNGEAQDLVTAGSTADGTMMYKLGENGTYSTNVPKAEDAGSYTVYYYVKGDSNYKDSEAQAISVTIEQLDITDKANIALVESLTYNGAEQMMGVSSVKVDGLDVTYTVSGNTGTAAVDYTLTVTANGNFKGAAEKLWSIAKNSVVISAEDQTITYGGTISAEGYDSTGLIDDHTATVILTPSTSNVTVNGTITASGAVITADGTDVTENYSFSYVTGKLVIEPDTSKIDGLTTENVTSANESDIQAVIAMMASAETEGADDATKAEWAAITENGEALLAVIDDASSAAETEHTEQVEDVTAENVAPEDKEALEDAKADLEKALDEYGENYTEEEKKAIQEEIQRIEDALEALENVEDVTEAITQLPETVEPDDEETTQKIMDAKEAYDNLTDHEKSLVEESTKAKLDNLVAALTAYDIIKGDGGKWTKGSSYGLSFTANGPFSKFVGIEVDGEEVAEKYYDAKSGSTIITLKQSYLKKLSTGEHTITVLYTDGEASGTFKILAQSSTPATGDNTNIVLWTSIMCVGTLGLVVLLLDNKRRRSAKEI